MPCKPQTTLFHLALSCTAACLSAAVPGTCCPHSFLQISFPAVLWLLSSCVTCSISTIVLVWQYCHYVSVRVQTSFNFFIFSTRCVRRMNYHTIAMMFVHPSVHLSGMAMHCDHMVPFSVDFRLWLDSSVFWAP